MNGREAWGMGLKMWRGIGVLAAIVVLVVIYTGSQEQAAAQGNARGRVPTFEGPGTAFDVTLSHEPNQQFMYVADGTNTRTRSELSGMSEDL